MKKKVFVFSIIMMTMFLAITFTSCRTHGPDISHLSEVINGNDVKLYWDFKNKAKPFEVLLSEQSATLTTVASSVSITPFATTLTDGSYHWQIKGANGSSSGVKVFEVPDN